MLLDSDQQRILEAWPTLPEALRAGILAMIQSAQQPGKQAVGHKTKCPTGPWRPFKTAHSHSDPFAFHKGST